MVDTINFFQIKIYFLFGGGGGFKFDFKQFGHPT